MKKVICIDDSNQDRTKACVRLGDPYHVLNELMHPCSCAKHQGIILYQLAEMPAGMLYYSSMFAEVSEIEETVLIETQMEYA